MAVISFSSRGLPFRWRGPAEAPTRPSSSNPPDTQIVPTYCQKRSLSTVLATREQPTVKCCSLMLVIASVRAQREPLQHQRKPQFPVVGQEKKGPVASPKPPFCASLCCNTMRLAKQKLNRPFTPLSFVHQSARLIAPGTHTNLFLLDKKTASFLRVLDHTTRPQ
jgi:hypothetical protein